MTINDVQDVLNSDTFREMAMIFDAFERIPNESDKEWLLAMAYKLTGDDVNVPPPPARIITLFNVH